MGVLENLKNLFFDVWNKGVAGVNISEIIIALSFLFFISRGSFKICYQRLENYVSKLQIILIILVFQWRDLQSFSNCFRFLCIH